MKIELEIPADLMNVTIIDVFKSLTYEDKKALAEKVLLSWMTEPMNTEHKLKEQQVIEYLRANEHYNFEDKSDNDIKHNYRFKQCMEKFKCTRDLMLIELCRESVSFIQKSLETLLKEDTEYKNMLEAQLKEVKDNFPKFVQEAVVTWFCQNIIAMTENLRQVHGNLDTLNDFMNNMRDNVNINRY